MNKNIKLLFDENFKNINYLDDILLNYQKTLFNFRKKTYVLNFNLSLIRTVKEFESLSESLLNYYYETFTFKKIIETEIEKIQIIFKELLSVDLIKINSENLSNEIIEKIQISIYENRKRFIVLYNMFFGFENYIYDVDLTDYKKLKKSDLKFADIVLSIKSDNLIKNSLYTKLIYFITNSHIQHATIFYGMEKNKYLFLDVIERYNNLNQLKFVKLQKKYDNENIGLVLRYKHDLSHTQKKLIRKYLNDVIGKKYGLSKVIFLSFLYEIFYKVHSYKKLKNPFSKRTVYCSENVVKAYDSAEIYLSNKYDYSTVTPIDLLNNAQLKIVGYIKK